MSIFNRLKKQPHQTSLLVYHLILVAIILINFPFGKWFLGWDSLTPELNFSLNFKRAFTSVWQENYGTGAMTGHAFATTLPHTITTYLLSLILPTPAIRPAFTFLCFYLGGLGTYFLIKSLIKKPYIALLSSLFYLFHLSTNQHFSVQLEAFIIHFAALPWLFYFTRQLLLHTNKKYLVYFLLINLIFSTQAFIPALFVVYSISLLIFLVFFVLNTKQFKKALLVITLTAAINAYWFIPFAYFNLTRKNDLAQAYNNLSNTPEFIEKSKKFGTLKYSALGQGLYWESFELGTYIMEPWRQHHQNPLIPFLGYTFFAITLVGLFYSILKHKHWPSLSFAFIFLFTFSNLAISTPPFSYLNRILGTISPTFQQAFRITFTKFSLAYAFSSAVLFSYGLLVLSKLYNKITYITLFGLIIYAWPLAQGNFFFQKMLLDLPPPYLEIIDYFRTQPNGRIADLPQDCSEGWYTYKWGYFGSGFYWYGVPQPFLSRTFDVWSKNNENYYWQISQALRNENYQQVDRILTQYNANWVLFDPNFSHCKTAKGFLNNSQLLNYLTTNPQYQLQKTFESDTIQPIYVFKINPQTSNQFVSTTNHLINVGPKYSFADFDLAPSLPYQTNPKQPYQIFYPFRQLFSKRNGLSDSDYHLDLTSSTLQISTTIPPNLTHYQFNIDYFNTQDYLPVKIDIQTIDFRKYQLNLTPLTPSVFLDNQLVNPTSFPIKIGSFSTRHLDQIKIIINGSLLDTNTTNLYLDFNNLIKIIDQSNNILLSWASNLATFNPPTSPPINLPNNYKRQLTIKIPITNDLITFPLKPITGYTPTLCNQNQPAQLNKYQINTDPDHPYLRLLTQHQSQCLTIPIPQISTNQSYLVSINSRHVQGNQLSVEISNKGKPAGLSLYLNSTNSFKPQHLILPPSFPNEIQYDFTFKSLSLVPQFTINDIKDVSLYQIPLNYLLDLNLTRPNPHPSNKLTIPSVKHPFETFYSIQTNHQPYYILYQSYSNDWLAFYFSGLKPVFLKNHTLVNNWANAWQIDQNTPNNTSIYILFWPQLLQFLGFALLIPITIYILKKPKSP